MISLFWIIIIKIIVIIIIIILMMNDTFPQMLIFSNIAIISGGWYNRIDSANTTFLLISNHITILYLFPHGFSWQNKVEPWVSEVRLYHFLSQLNVVWVENDSRENTDGESSPDSSCGLSQTLSAAVAPVLSSSTENVQASNHVKHCKQAWTAALHKPWWKTLAVSLHR